MTLQYPAQAPEDFLNLSAFAVDGLAAHLSAFGNNERLNGFQPIGTSQRTQDINGSPMIVGRVSIPLERGHEGSSPWSKIDTAQTPTATLLSAYSSALANVTTTDDLQSLAVYALLGFASHYKSHIERQQTLGQRFNVETDITQDVDGSPLFIGTIAILETSEAAGGANHWDYTDGAHLEESRVYTNVLAQFATP